LATGLTYEGKIFEIVEKEVNEKGIKKTFEFARRSPGVRLIIKTKNNSLLMSREYRHEHSGFDLRLPGGKVFDTQKEFKEFLASKRDVLPFAENAAKREAEEVGIKVSSLNLYETSKVGATVIWDLLYFIVDAYELLGKGKNLERGESIETIEVGTEDVKMMCLSGKIKEERSALILLRYLNQRG